MVSAAFLSVINDEKDKLKADSSSDCGDYQQESLYKNTMTIFKPRRTEATSDFEGRTNKIRTCIKLLSNRNREKLLLVTMIRMKKAPSRKKWLFPGDGLTILTDRAHSADHMEGRCPCGCGLTTNPGGRTTLILFKLASQGSQMNFLMFPQTFDKEDCSKKTNSMYEDISDEEPSKNKIENVDSTSKSETPLIPNQLPIDFLICICSIK
ncbi:unnamed protein product [Mytilus edulis]|uniref:Uncharacterized protein n=1 Tax=Mytilus edulis TaxID=6550 RepID=A0A8S3PTH1_MYTED|nr:unnamed protein product [Mytilus edulis]